MLGFTKNAEFWRITANFGNYFRASFSISLTKDLEEKTITPAIITKSTSIKT